MKHLKLCAKYTDYLNYLDTEDFASPNVVYIQEMDKVIYNAEPTLPIYVEAVEPATVAFPKELEYSRDNITWEALEAGVSVDIKAGARVYFRANFQTGYAGAMGIGTFTLDGACSVGGSIMSLFYGNDYKGKRTQPSGASAYRLFKGASPLIDASRLLLPVTDTIYESMYREMFYGCTNLVSAPLCLPAATLRYGYAYDAMFKDCVSLVNAPYIRANYIYTSSTYAMRDMFYNCSSLVNAPALPAKTLGKQCYYQMFYGCTNLVTAPALPATSPLANACYYRMFYGCSKLSYIKAMLTTAPGGSYSGDWVYGVAASGTFVKNAAATWADTFGASAIPTGWTVETAEA